MDTWHFCFKIVRILYLLFYAILLLEFCIYEMSCTISNWKVTFQIGEIAVKKVQYFDSLYSIYKGE